MSEYLGKVSVVLQGLRSRLQYFHCIRDMRSVAMKGMFFIFIDIFVIILLIHRKNKGNN